MQISLSLYIHTHVVAYVQHLDALDGALRRRGDGLGQHLGCGQMGSGLHYYIII